MTDVDSRRFVNASHVAQSLGVLRCWVMARVRAGDIPHRRVARYVRFDADEVERWVREGGAALPGREPRSGGKVSR